MLFSGWFPPSKRGLPMGIFSVWVPLESMFIMGASGFFFALGTACVMNFEMPYMAQTMGMDQGEANGMLNIANIVVVIGGITTSMNRLNSPIASAVGDPFSCMMSLRGYVAYRLAGGLVRLRDGVYRRTLFVAPGRSALVAASVRGTSHDGLNLLVRDGGAVAAYEREFGDYLALCRPLMRVEFPENESRLAELIGGFVGSDGRLAASLDGETLVCAQEGVGALVVNVGKPLIAFTIDEPRMASAVEDYLDNLPRSMVCRDAAARRLVAELNLT